jgi:hypothetical protein
MFTYRSGRCGGISLGILAVGLGMVCGCGGGSQGYPVEGKVVWSNGSPAKELAGGTVQFEGTGDVKTRNSATGEIDDNGNFKMSSDVPPGKYRVAVIPILDAPDPDIKRKVSPLDPRFHSLDESKIEVNVEAKKNENVVIKVAKKR